MPSSAPSSLPSLQPSGSPSETPQSLPSSHPSSSPSSLPSLDPSSEPSGTPSETPSSLPSLQPSGSPSESPQSSPSSDLDPSSEPSETPTRAPTISVAPSISQAPSYTCERTGDKFSVDLAPLSSVESNSFGDATVSYCAGSGQICLDINVVLDPSSNGPITSVKLYLLFLGVFSFEVVDFGITSKVDSVCVDTLSFPNGGWAAFLPTFPGLFFLEVTTLQYPAGELRGFTEN